MFYSHQLLARKAPLGQIWMAATMHAKINRRKLDQIDIIRICEEILNPSVPMALRLSGILMGGVVIVYERKVRLLYDDVNRLLIEINAAWKVKPAVDPTVLPKGKTQAKFEAVTLPENQDIDIGDVEQSIDYSSKFTARGFQQSAYFAMRLDTIDELTESLRENEPHELHHQADIANITLDDPFDAHRADTGPYNRFERFDIEGDEETQYNIPSQEHTQIPTAPVHSPPAMQPEKDDIPVRHEEKQQQPQQGLQNRRPPRKTAKRRAPFFMDDQQTLIPNNLYQSWLQDSTDISARRPNIGKVNPKSTMKFTKKMELPPGELCCGLLGRDHALYYPEQLLGEWLRSIQPPHDSPSGAPTSKLAPQPSSSSSPHRQEYQDPPQFPIGDFGTGIGSDRLASLERLRDLRTGSFNFNLMSNGVSSTDPKPQTGSSGTHSRSFVVPSPVPEINYSSNISDSNSGGFNKKRPLESLDEILRMHETAEHNCPVFNEQAEPSFKIPRRSRLVPTPEHEILIETAATQTQRPFFVDEETENMTRNIMTHLKTYFEAPGAPKTESLNQLAYGMNRKQAAQLFYQTCVLATRDILKVQQNLAFGDITISRGVKM